MKKIKKLLFLLLISTNSCISASNKPSTLNITKQKVNTEASVMPSVNPSSPNPDEELSLDERIEKIIKIHCLSCHQQNPSFLFPAGGVVLNNLENIQKYNEDIYQRVVVQADMPPKREAMSAQERHWISEWYRKQQTEN